MDKIIIMIVLFLVSVAVYHQITKTSRLRFIKTYRFHPALRKKVHLRYPHLSDNQLNLVVETLRDYFFMTHRANKAMVSMPSQVVDVAWHEFILFTRTYKEFCDRGLGRFLYHTPTEAMKTPTLAKEGIKRAWRLACLGEKINPSKPERLPMIFGIDALLDIPDGFHYVLDCSDPTSPTYGSGYCASNIGCTGGCASGCGGDSGGDGGGGCGGGGD